MFDYIKGILTDLSQDKAVVDVNGLGYLLYIPQNTFGKAPSLGRAVCFYISVVIREDSQKMYGFLTKEERDLFERVSEVSGIGPKTALSLISHISGSELQAAIANANIARLSKIPGVGKKTAERLIVEMRDRLKKSPIPAATPHDALSQDAQSALVNLGFNIFQSQLAVSKALTFFSEAPELSMLIAAALKHI